ncbi:MAG TPA: hypothetical protein VFZ34_19920 [Blastocatellia bacterium]|nr:hypothetical protein [Blastocatellia bacterium]
MKKFIQITLLLCFSFIATQAIAQDPATTNGPVWRITYLKEKPSKRAEYTRWLREYRSRVLAEYKSAGLIVDYKYFTKPTDDGSPGDWDIAEAVMYRNYAETLDAPTGERLKKFQELPILTKVFGSAENRTKVWAELRDASRDIVRTSIIRELNVNPVKQTSSSN